MIKFHLECWIELDASFVFLIGLYARTSDCKFSGLGNVRWTMFLCRALHLCLVRSSSTQA